MHTVVMLARNVTTPRSRVVARKRENFFKLNHFSQSNPSTGAWLRFERNLFVKKHDGDTILYFAFCESTPIVERQVHGGLEEKKPARM
jgi:hypothetical protein